MSGMLDNAAHMVRQAGKKGDLKPKTHHFFYVLVWICGCLAPPLAVFIRFGLGRDFFINVLCTICGYFPGHFHNFYCQTIRNNNNAARTPKWAVKYGLVKVRDKRGGKSQWASRYDERLPDSAQHGYGDDDSSLQGSEGGAAWDGRGPEPAKKGSSRFGSGSKSEDAKALFTPWAREVDPDEVEDGYGGSGLSRSGTASSTSGRGGAFDPIDNEDFYTPSAAADEPSLGRSSSRKSPTKSGKKPKGIKGILSHRDRYEPAAPEPSDRFDRMAAAKEEYADEFERELNEGAGAPKPAPARFDSFEQEGPEDAWAAKPVQQSRTGGSAPIRQGSASSARAAPAPLSQTKTGGTVKGSREDDDLFNHTF